ncbi:hypothetical protein P171DRAFT_57449 [Karstenula rhodostoma CBS 690.94]|uniref:Zn(2)-C6 fungal-type domain-containing protein n=1 Tax=Karstenula rhodostoma CBS 690.94 TaxID=1392251 RepID=A0A9P4PFU0_9PLEO|nr:hypothetical protein P171DRAFT_57449 [Karstenula rhodostoma CBS 690.94]
MIGLPHQSAAGDSTPSHSIITMEAREGRIGNAFACERCRKHKVRCVPSEAAGICQRCQKARVECIEHVARRRPAKPRTVVQPTNKVAEMEKRIEKLHAIVTSTTTPAVASSKPHSTLPPVASIPSQSAELSRRPSTPAPIVPSAPPSAVVKTPILPNPGSTPESALSFWESMNDVVSGLGRLDPVIRSISIIHMQSLLDMYRTMAEFFPFVLLPRECFCGDLIQQRPIFLFAVLTAASFDSSHLQVSLSREFRKVVMVKIMNGEKSLDLLQGLLVFIAWHHHYMDAHATSVHLLLQICVGIAGDLGLDNIPSHTRSTVQKDDAWHREAKRAYLGCYYLASSLSLLESGRARSMSHSSTLQMFARDIADAWEHRSDAIVPILIDMCQFMEDVEDTFGDHSEPALVTKAQLKRLSEKWDQMQSATKAQANDYRTLRWIQLVARAHLYKATASLDIYDRDSMPWVSGFQLSQRITCLRCVEQFLDYSLQLSSSEYELLSITDWLALVAGLTTLAKLALHTSPMPGWDPVELQISKSFGYFRDQLSAQMPRPHDSQDQGEDLFERFRRITAIMKMTVKAVPGRSSPNGSTFELATGSGRTVSLLQELPPLKPNGAANGSDSLPPAPWKVSPQFDISNQEFLWKFLTGSI